ncbi:hypothetical protein ANN_24955 [Periplaneta americana]|uniref:Uncharacterized protein n=1 Tax=Periplaneta americana TaxID=6978 RepID=A0ABQ8S0L0_PERAM|nr:hypothetical protein ANN_24955 [Periplaneta americana]
MVGLCEGGNEPPGSLKASGSAAAVLCKAAVTKAGVVNTSCNHRHSNGYEEFPVHCCTSCQVLVPKELLRPEKAIFLPSFHGSTK